MPRKPKFLGRITRGSRVKPDSLGPLDLEEIQSRGREKAAKIRRSVGVKFKKTKAHASRKIKKEGISTAGQAAAYAAVMVLLPVAAVPMAIGLGIKLGVGYSARSEALERAALHLGESSERDFETFMGNEDYKAVAELVQSYARVGRNTGLDKLYITLFSAKIAAFECLLGDDPYDNQAGGLEAQLEGIAVKQAQFEYLSQNVGMLLEDNYAQLNLMLNGVQSQANVFIELLSEHGDPEVNSSKKRLFKRKVQHKSLAIKRVVSDAKHQTGQSSSFFVSRAVDAANAPVLGVKAGIYGISFAANQLRESVQKNNANTIVERMRERKVEGFGNFFSHFERELKRTETVVATNLNKVMTKINGLGQKIIGDRSYAQKQAFATDLEEIKKLYSELNRQIIIINDYVSVLKEIKDKADINYAEGQAIMIQLIDQNNALTIEEDTAEQEVDFGILDEPVPTQERIEGREITSLEDIIRQEESPRKEIDIEPVSSPVKP